MMRTVSVTFIIGVSMALPINNVHVSKNHGSIKDITGTFDWVQDAQIQFPVGNHDRFVSADSGLLFGDYQTGVGRILLRGDLAHVHYKAYRVGKDGTVLTHVHSDVEEGSVGFRFAVGTGRTNRGFDEAVREMRVGGKRVALVPPPLAYGLGQRGHKDHHRGPNKVRGSLVVRTVPARVLYACP